MMIKKSKLERFVRDNREDFDAAEPSLDLWARIEQQLPPVATKVIPLQPEMGRSPSSSTPWYQARLWRVAALITVVLGVGFGTYRFVASPHNTDPEVAKVNPDQARTVFQYASLIESKRDELQQLEQENPELYQEFATEVAKLDQDYEMLKSQLSQTPNQELLVEAMITNLQRQIDLLNTQLSIIQRIKQQKSHDNRIQKDTIV
jgi:anti-sigma-K factor RskA